MLERFNFAKDHDFKGQICLMRVDFNVPLQDGVISDDTRIQRIIPGIQRLLAQGARMVLISHLGRPKGEVKSELTLQPIASYLSSLLGQSVGMIEDVTSADAVQQTSLMADGEILLAENIRFWKGEEANDPEFAAQLAKLGDVFIADAFSAAHRAHASTAGITAYLPSFAGDALDAELSALQAALEAPKRPVVAVVGGAKVSTKLAVLEHLIERTDALILGGGMANSFLGAQGMDMKASLSEPDLFDTARQILKRADTVGCQLVIPVDGLATKEFKAGADYRAIANEELEEGEMMLDVGPASIEAALQVIKGASTILWNGPMGAFEIEPFDKATIALAQAVAERTQSGDVVSVAGGGDTVAALNVAGVAGEFSYVSLAGGAFLEWLEGKSLPGIAALEQ